MPCTTVTVQGEQAQNATATITGKSGGTNEATLEFDIDNPNSFGVIATVEYVKDGSKVTTEDIQVPSSGTSDTRKFTGFGLSPGEGQQTFNLCVNVVGTEAQ